VSNLRPANPRAGSADGAQAAELPPLPPSVIAGSPPDSYGDSPTQTAAGPPLSADDQTTDGSDGRAHPDDMVVESDDSALDPPSDPAAPGGATAQDAPAATGSTSEKTIDSVRRLEILLQALGQAANLFRPEDAPPTSGDMVVGGYFLMLTFLGNMDVDSERTETLASLMGLFLLLRADAAASEDSTGAVAPPTTTTDEGTTAAATEPAKAPPRMGKRAKKQQREWVSLPAPAVIYEAYPTVEKRKLKTGVWYQMKENDDGSRDFYNKKGNWLGTSPIDDRDKVEVRMRGEEVGE